jgi:hypothetical protein
LSPATSPTLLMLLLRGRTDFYLIVEYYIHNITINFHVDDDVMEKKHALSEGRLRTINPLR